MRSQRTKRRRKTRAQSKRMALMSALCLLFSSLLPCSLCQCAGQVLVCLEASSGCCSATTTSCCSQHRPTCCQPTPVQSTSETKRSRCCGLVVCGISGCQADCSPFECQSLRARVLGLESENYGPDVGNADDSPFLLQWTYPLQPEPFDWFKSLPRSSTVRQHLLISVWLN